MIPLLLSDVSRIVGGTLHGADRSIDSVTTDTRTIRPGELFLALTGERFDGHQFAGQALAQGAAALLVSRRLPLAAPQIQVADTRLALGTLGQWLKGQLAPKTVAITGSNGKTTVKEMVAAILAQAGPTLATAGNFNNDIGVPLTLLRLEPEHRFAILELGANHPGEIAYTAGLVAPDAVAITNVAPAHLAGFGSLAGVAQAKGEILAGLAPTGAAVLGADSEYLPQWRAQLGPAQRLVTVGLSGPADYRAEQISLSDDGQAGFTLHTPSGSLPVSLPLLGRHNVVNALFAAALSQQLGCSLAQIRAGLASMTPVPGRLNPQRLGERLMLIDDSYNANLASVCAAIDLLADSPGRRLLVLGDMGELGEQAADFHVQAGEHARGQGIDAVYTLGTLSRHSSRAAGGYHSETLEALVEALLRDIQQTQQRVTILVKGSRSAAMERVIQGLQAGYPEAAQC